MNAEIITIGDELLIGQVINTNQAYIAEKLNSVGIYCDRMTTIGDNRNDILESFSTAFSRSDVVCVTGGLGPTHDDITKKLVCEFFQTDYILNEEVLANITTIFQRRNIIVSQVNRDQALVPRSCTVMPNKLGTAPGMMFEQNGKYFFVMPGVPFEMKGIVDSWIIPFFEGKNVGTIVRHRTLKTTGIPESALANEIGNVEEVIGTDGTVTLAFLPNPVGTKLRITVKETSVTSAENKLQHAESVIRSKVEKYIYASDTQELEDVVGMLLKQQKLTLATAESCTGGMIANRITNVSGSSGYFLRGFITYSNQSKIEELGVAEELLIAHGAVSKEVAEAMARGARNTAKTEIAISVTGIAGPTGGTEEKPVGTCWIGYSDAKTTFGLKFNFGEDRIRFKERASQAALDLLRRKLLKK